MEINNVDDARAWLRAWDGKPRKAVLAHAIEGLRMGLSIMEAAPTRHSEDARADRRAAIAALERAGGAS